MRVNLNVMDKLQKCRDRAALLSIQADRLKLDYAAMKKDLEQAKADLADAIDEVLGLKTPSLFTEETYE